MKKIILEEVNRNRQIMGLKPIMEQWEDNLLKSLGLDVEKILAKTEADLIPVEKNLITSIEKHAGPDTDKVLRSFGKGSLKNDFPAIFKKIEQEMLSNADKDISKAFLDSFYITYPEASRIKGAIDNEALGNLIKKYEDAGMVKQAESELEKIRKSLDTLPDGAFKDDLLKTFESKYGQSSAKAKVSQQNILSDLDTIKSEVKSEIKEFGTGGLSKIYREKNSKDFVRVKKRIADSIQRLEEMASDPALLDDFTALKGKMDELDASVIEKAYFKVFGKWAEPLWAKSYLGKAAVVAILMSIASTFGITITTLVDRCLPVIQGIAKFLTIDTSMCSTKKEGEGNASAGSKEETPKEETKKLTPDEEKAVKEDFNKKYGNSEPKIKNITVISKDKVKVSFLTVQNGKLVDFDGGAEYEYTLDSAGAWK